MPTKAATSVDLLRWTRYATYAYLLAVPGLVESLYLLRTHDTARALQAALCCLAILAWSQKFDPSTVRLTRTQTGLLGLTITLTLASIWQAQWPVFAATEACLWVGLIALVWVFAISPTQALTKEVPGVVVIAVGLMGLLELRDIAFAWLSSSPLDAAAVGYGHSNRRHFNHVQTMALIMAAMVMWGGSERWMRWGAWFGVSVGLALIWFAGARSTSLALIVTCVTFIALTGSSKALWLQRVLVALGCGVLAFLIFYQWIPNNLGISLRDTHTMGERSLSTSTDRLLLWQAAWQMAAEHPLVGWGGQHFVAHTPLPLAHPHNIVLQWAAEWGWVLTLLTLVGLGRWTQRLWIASWRRAQGLPWGQTPLVTAAWLATLAAFVDSMFSGTLTMPVSQVWWCFCIGVALPLNIKRPTPPMKNLSAQCRLLKYSTSLAAISTLLMVTIVSYNITYQATPGKTKEQSIAKPRLWAWGSID